MPKASAFHLSSIEDYPKSATSPVTTAPGSSGFRRANESGLSDSTMVTRSQCSGDCPINSLARTRNSARKTTRASSAQFISNLDDDHHLHDHHSHNHTHHHRNHYTVEPRRGLADQSDEEDEIAQPFRKNGRRLARNDDSSDEEITLIRRTTNKISTYIETSSRKMKSASTSKKSSLAIILVSIFSVYYLSSYYYDHSPLSAATDQTQTSQQNALLSSISKSSSPPSSPSGQSMSPLPFSTNQPFLNSQCNSTPSSASREEITILNKRLDKLEQLVLKLIDENSKESKYINTVNERVNQLTKEGRGNAAAFEERFDTITKKLEEAIETNKQVIRSKETASIEEIEAMIKQAIYLYDSDKTGKADYALETLGGSIVESRCSETHDPYGIKYSIWGIPVWYTSNSPRAVIQASMTPGECWAFPGSMGNVTIKLSARIVPTEFSYEHINKEISRDGNINSAPKALQIRGLKDEHDFEGVLLGNYVYHDNDQPLQVFSIQNNKGRPFRFITLIVLSNHGHPDYTCLYRFRVHGRQV